MSSRRTLKVAVCLLPVSIGAVDSIREYGEMMKHPEWSAPPSVIWIKFAVYFAVSLLLLARLFLVKKK